MVNKNYKSLVSNSFYLINAQIFVRIIRSLYIIIIVRYLGPELYGVFQYSQNWFVTFTPLTLCGMGAIMSREIGKNKKIGQNLIETTLVIRIISSCVLSVIILTIGYSVETDLRIKNLLFIFSFLIIGRSLVNWVKEVFIAYEISKYHMVQVTISNIVQFILAVLIMFYGGNVYYLASIYVISLFLEFFFSFIFIKNTIIDVKMRFVASNIISVFKQGFPIGISIALDRWMFFGPIIICRFILDYSFDLGQIALVLLLLFFLSLFFDAFLNAALPIFSRMFLNNGEVVHSMISKVIQIVLIFGSFLAISGMCFGEAMFAFIFGDQYIKAGEIIGQSIWLLIPYMITRSISQTFILKEKVLILSFYSALGVMFMTIFLPFFIAKFGIIGVIYSIGIGMIISLVGLIYSAYSKNYIQIHYLNITVFSFFLAIIVYLVSSIFFQKTLTYLLSIIVLLPVSIREVLNVYKSTKILS